MRMTMMLLLALAGLGACDRNSSEASQAAVKAVPAALTFEGADFRDQASKIAHGKRLTIVLDCTGCHGSDLQGTNLAPEAGATEAMYAPNLTLLLAKYGDAELDKLIRHGVPRDAREFWFMPVESYQFLSDADFSAIVAYLRTIKPAGKPLPAFKLNHAQQKDVDQGNLGNAQAQIAKYRDHPPQDLGPQYAWGRHLARMTCAQCHNNALQGWPNFTPNLDIAGAYSKAELTHLLATGEGKTKKKNFGMAEIAGEHFSHLTPREREAIVDYVLARADRPQ